VVDVDSPCRHDDWRDPGFGAWVEVVEGPGDGNNGDSGVNWRDNEFIS